MVLGTFELIRCVMEWIGPALLAMIWSKYTEASKLPLTEHVASRLRALEASLQLRFPLQLAPSSDDQPLAFKPLALKETKLLPSGTAPREFLLEHCGPYLERSFDSAPDPRVPSFHPDAWQRKVLDAIDANKSVLAVAPTSAGKTFISFYAMKKVLQANFSHRRPIRLQIRRRQCVRGLP